MPSPSDPQAELMRRAEPRERAAMALRLSDEVIALSRRAIARSFTELDDEGRRLKFVELHYGKDLAERLRAFLSARRRTA